MLKSRLLMCVALCLFIAGCGGGAAAPEEDTDLGDVEVLGPAEAIERTMAESGGEADEEADTPAEETDTPGEETDAPAEETDTPGEETDTPAEETDTPAEEDEPDADPSPEDAP